MVDRKIEEFLSCFEEKIKDLTEEAFSTQVNLHFEKLFFELHDSVTAICRFSEVFWTKASPFKTCLLLCFAAVL